MKTTNATLNRAIEDQIKLGKANNCEDPIIKAIKYYGKL